MTLKNARLARAENLPEEIRQQFRLPSEGLIIIESNNPDLRENFISINEQQGIWEYLKGLDEFNDIEISEE